MIVLVALILSLCALHPDKPHDGRVVAHPDAGERLVISDCHREGRDVRCGGKDYTTGFVCKVDAQFDYSNLLVVITTGTCDDTAHHTRSGLH